MLCDRQMRALYQTNYIFFTYRILLSMFAMVVPFGPLAGYAQAKYPRPGPGWAAAELLRRADHVFHLVCAGVSTLRTVDTITKLKD